MAMKSWLREREREASHYRNCLREVGKSFIRALQLREADPFSVCQGGIRDWKFSQSHNFASRVVKTDTDRTSESKQLKNTTDTANFYFILR